MFIGLLSLFSSYFYLFLTAFREPQYHLHYDVYLDLSGGIEIIFVIFSLLQFVKAYTPEYSEKGTSEVRDLKKIANRYFENGFLLDLLSLLPFQFMTLPRHRERLLFLLKVVRIRRGFELFNIPKFMKVIKHHYEHKLKKKIA